ncbi:MAG: hypothetical protein QE284_11645 [Rhizobium sp.]|nr:hypothetical protein [Rhizobium sp.]
MSFVFSSLGRRLTAAIALSLLTAGCSGSDRIPLADIGGPQKGDVLVGRLVAMREGRGRVGRVGEVSPEAVAYASPTAAANGGRAGIDYLDTPNLADGEASVEPPMQAAEAYGAPGVGLDESQSQSAMVIPEGGVNLDGELGIGAGEASMVAASPEGVQPQIVTQGGAMAIAEGHTAQPVVDGIGFDNPEALVTGPVTPAAVPTELAEQTAGEDPILPLSADSGTTGLDTASEPVTPARAQHATRAAPSADACALYLDKSNCRTR